MKDFDQPFFSGKISGDRWIDNHTPVTVKDLIPPNQGDITMQGLSVIIKSDGDVEVSLIDPYGDSACAEFTLKEFIEICEGAGLRFVAIE